MGFVKEKFLHSEVWWYLRSVPAWAYKENVVSVDQRAVAAVVAYARMELDVLHIGWDPAVA